MQNAKCRTQNGRGRFRKIISDIPPTINSECGILELKVASLRLYPNESVLKIHLYTAAFMWDYNSPYRRNFACYIVGADIIRRTYNQIQMLIAGDGVPDIPHIIYSLPFNVRFSLLRQLEILFCGKSATIVLRSALCV